MKKVIVYTSPFTKNGVQQFVGPLSGYGNDVIAISISKSNEITPISNPASFDFSDTKILVALENQFDVCYSWPGILKNCNDLYLVLHKTGQAHLIEIIREYILKIEKLHNVRVHYKIESHVRGSSYYEWLPKVLGINLNVTDLVDELIKTFPDPVMEEKLELLHRCLVPGDAPSLEDFENNFKHLGEFASKYKEFKEKKKTYREQDTDELVAFTDNDVFDPQYIEAVKQLRIALLGS